MSRKRPMNRSRLLLYAAALVAAACQDRQSPTAAPSFLIQDATHNSGNPHFYWLPPMTRQPSFTGTFDGTLSPVVEIREFAGLSPCVANRLVGAVTLALTGDGTACRPGRDCGEVVVTPVPGQDVTVLTTAQTAGLFIPAAALREQIVVLIESRSDRPCIPRDRMALPQFDDCYRYEVTPTTSIERLSVRQAATGEVNTSYVFGDGKDETLADNVTVGMCVELGTLT